MSPKIMACHQICHLDYDPQESYSTHYDQPELSSLFSQLSLASVPSLTSSSQLVYSPQEAYFSAVHHHCVATLKGHSSYVSSLTFAGKFLYTGSSEKEIRSWKRSLMEPEVSDHENVTSNVAAVGKGAVKSLVVLADKLFSAHQDHKIRVWRINTDGDDSGHPTYTHLATLPTLGDRAMKLLMPKNHVRVRRHKTCTWVHHVDTVSALALSRDETLLYSVSWDRTLKIWRTSDFKCLESVGNAHDDAINAVASSNDGDVYTGSADKTIKVWRKNPGETKHSLVATLEKHNSGVNALALSNDGSVLYSGASDRSIVVWEKDFGGGGMEVVGALRGHTKAILCLAVVSDIVCSGSADKTVRVWRGFEGNYCCLAVLEGHRGPVKCLAGAIDSCNSSDVSYLVYSGSLDCDIKVWRIALPLL